MSRGLSELQKTILSMAYENNMKYTSEAWIKKEIEEHNKLRIMLAYEGVSLKKNTHLFILTCTIMKSWLI